MKIIEYKVEIKNKFNVFINISTIKAGFKIIGDQFLFDKNLKGI